MEWRLQHLDYRSRCGSGVWRNTVTNKILEEYRPTVDSRKWIGSDKWWTSLYVYTIWTWRSLIRVRQFINRKFNNRRGNNRMACWDVASLQKDYSCRIRIPNRTFSSFERLERNAIFNTILLVRISLSCLIYSYALALLQQLSTLVHIRIP